MPNFGHKRSAPYGFAGTQGPPMDKQTARRIHDGLSVCSGELLHRVPGEVVARADRIAEVHRQKKA